MNYFKGIIKCSYCNKNYNYRSNNGVEQFICGTVKNKGRSNCPNSRYLNLDDLLDIIDRHCKIHDGKDWHISKAKLFILRVEIGDELIIRWRDGLVSKVSDNEIVF